MGNEYATVHQFLTLVFLRIMRLALFVPQRSGFLTLPIVGGWLGKRIHLGLDLILASILNRRQMQIMRMNYHMRIMT